MLINLALGTVPSNFTIPRRLAAPLVLGGGPPAFTAWGLDIQIAIVRMNRATNFLAYITTSPQIMISVS
jgi:hypothetical protein